MAWEHRTRNTSKRLDMFGRASSKEDMNGEPKVIGHHLVTRHGLEVRLTKSNCLPTILDLTSAKHRPLKSKRRLGSRSLNGS
ncbi:hypothetical protein CR513_55116, partial [Mucuna pruriens]